MTISSLVLVVLAIFFVLLWAAIRIVDASAASAMVHAVAGAAIALVACVLLWYAWTHGLTMPDGRRA